MPPLSKNYEVLMSVSEGKILKGIGGFYYVEAADSIIECKARGAFRSKGESVLVGDMVKIEYDSESKKGVIENILPRKNSLVRPSVSNIDKLYIVCSTTLPAPNFLNIDKLIAMAIYSDIEPIIVISKTDLDSAQTLCETYKKAGFSVFEVNYEDSASIEKIKQSLENKTSVFTGNSGVGKSTLINAMFKDLELKTGEVSTKLSRGKHTTRHIELFPLENGGYLADTPGFSSIDFEAGEIISKENVIDCFPDLLPFAEDCRFPDCRHIGERDCGVKDALQNDKVVKSRYESYCTLYKEAEKIKSWEKRNK